MKRLYSFIGFGLNRMMNYSHFKYNSVFSQTGKGWLIRRRIVIAVLTLLDKRFVVLAGSGQLSSVHDI